METLSAGRGGGGGTTLPRAVCACPAAAARRMKSTAESVVVGCRFIRSPVPCRGGRSGLSVEAGDELVGGEPGRFGEFGAPCVVLKIFLPDAHHVVARDLIALRVDVHGALAAAAGLGVNDLGEGDGAEL